MRADTSDRQAERTCKACGWSTPVGEWFAWSDEHQGYYCWGRLGGDEDELEDTDDGQGAQDEFPESDYDDEVLTSVAASTAMAPGLRMTTTSFRSGSWGAR
jgi:hypothetical protein